MASPAVVIGQVRSVAPASAAVTARLAIDALLGDLATTSAGLPPQSVLLLRSLKLGVPRAALTRIPDASLRERFAAAANHALRDAARRAARPARDAASGAELAVLFADEAELLACLARDAARGELDRWWWRTLLGGDYPEWTQAFVVRQEAAPAALRLLARLGLEPFAREALERRFAFRPVLATESAARGVARRPSDTQSTLNEPEMAAPLRAQPVDLELRARLARPHDQDAELDVHRPFTRSFASVPSVRAQVAGRAASRLSVASAGEREVEQSELTPLDCLDVDERQGPVSSVASLVAQPRGQASLASDEAHVMCANPFEAAPSSEAPSQHEAPPNAPVLPIRPASLLTRTPVTAVPSSPREGASLVELIARVAGGLPPQQLFPAKPDDRAHDLTPVSPEPAPAAHHPAVEAPLPLDDLSSEVSSEIPVLTDFGGVFFLVNVFLAEGLYPDFTRPRDRGFPVPLWRLLALVALRLLGRKLRDDPLFALLLTLEDGPVTESVELGAFWAPPSTPRLRADGDPLQLWLTGFVRWLRPALSEALGWPLRDVARRLLSARSRVWVTPGAIVCVFPLCAHPVETRLAGLDREPGFLPSAGRRLSFVFE